MATTQVVLIPRFVEHIDSLLIFTSAQVSLDVAVAHEIEMDIPNDFSKAVLHRLTISLINIATLLQNPSTFAGLRLTRQNVIAHDHVFPDTTRQWKGEANASSAVTRIHYTWSWPFQTALLPEDKIFIDIPVVDTNATPTVDIVIRELSLRVLKW